MVEVEVVPFYLADESDVAADVYAFGYRVAIRNRGDAPVRLLARHWVITDANGHIEEVRGRGVVGETPRIEAGGVYEYDSWTRLTTPWGSMRGSYQMVGADGERFDADIPEFRLVAPRSLH